MEISSKGHREEKGIFSYQIVEVLTHVFIVKLTIGRPGPVYFVRDVGALELKISKPLIVLPK